MSLKAKEYKNVYGSDGGFVSGWTPPSAAILIVGKAF